MKKFLLAILLSFLYFHLFSNDLTTDSAESMKQLKLYRNVRTSGIILTSIGGTILVCGLIYEGFFIFNPAKTPGSIPLYSASESGGSYYYSMSAYINPAILCINLTGIGLTVAGIAQIIWAYYKEKRLKEKKMVFLKNINPKFAYDFYHKKIYLGLDVLF